MINFNKCPKIILYMPTYESGSYIIKVDYITGT